jgi:hypothetical protein
MTRKGGEVDVSAMPPVTADTALKIAANAALEAKAAALEAAGMAGEAIGAASAAERAAKLAFTEAEKIHGKVDSLIEDVRDIAKAVGVKRTFSGSVLLDQSLLSRRTLDVSSVTTDTGRHAVVSHEVIDDIKRKFAEQEREKAEEAARREGAEAALQALRDEQEARERELEKAAKLAKDRRDRVMFWIKVASSLGTVSAIGLGWLLAHVRFR